jgi:hypothetical protein
VNQYQTTAVAPKKRPVTTPRVSSSCPAKKLFCIYPKTSRLVHSASVVKKKSFSTFCLRYDDENTMKLAQFQKNAQLIGIVGYRFLLVTQGRTCFLLGLALLSLVLASSLA